MASDMVDRDASVEREPVMRAAVQDAASVAEAQHDQLLATYLEHYSEPCPSCRYDLYRLRGRHCPECGQQLRLRISLENPRLAAFISGLVCLAAGMGFATLVGLWGLILFLFSYGPELHEMAILAVGSVVGGALVALWCRCGSWLRRQRALTRWALAGLCALFPVIMVTAVILVFN